MVQFSPYHPRRRDIASLALVVLLVSLSLAACSSPGDDPATVTVDIIPTRTPAPSASSDLETATRMTAASTVEPTAIPTTVEHESTAETHSQGLAADIAELVNDTGGLVEVVVARPDGTTLSEINSYEPIESASLYKLSIMVEIFAQRDMGDLAFNEEIVLDSAYFLEEDSVFGEGDIGYAVTIETLLQTMISLSSNVAATALLARVGNDSVNLTMASLGLTATEIRWTPGSVGDDPPLDDEEPAIEESEVPSDEDATFDEEPTDEVGSTAPDRSLLRVPVRQQLLDQRADAALNVTNAADIAELYVMLINGQVVSESASQEMLVLLEDQQINDRLPAYLPEDTVVAHKTGNLDGLVHDAGVIFAPAGPIVVVVLTGDLEESQANNLIATIARLAYDAN